MDDEDSCAWTVRQEASILVEKAVRIVCCKFSPRFPIPLKREFMQYKQLGNSDLLLSPLGIGAWAIGGAGWAFSWSSQDDRDSVKAIHAALDAGMNWIDTAAVYGLGHSEEVVAQALQSYSGKRPLVFTKCGRNWNQERQIQKDLRPASIRLECENSLRRLQVETIDLYQIHWP